MAKRLDVRNVVVKQAVGQQGSVGLDDVDSFVVVVGGFSSGCNEIGARTSE